MKIDEIGDKEVGGKDDGDLPGLLLRHCLTVLGLSQSIMSPRKPDSPGVRFQDRKGIFGPKVHFLSAAACPFPFPELGKRETH